MTFLAVSLRLLLLPIPLSLSLFLCLFGSAPQVAQAGPLYEKLERLREALVKFARYGKGEAPSTRLGVPRGTWVFP